MPFYFSWFRSYVHGQKSGGCFHSRTAVGMFDHVKEAVDKGEVLLEWDYSQVIFPCTLASSAVLAFSFFYSFCF